MNRTLDAETFEAVARLLSQPDPDDLPRRAHTLRCPGDPNRRATRLPALFMAWLQWRCLAVDGEQRFAPVTRFAAPKLAHGAATRRHTHADWHGGELAPAAASSGRSRAEAHRGPGMRAWRAHAPRALLDAFASKQP